MKLGRNKQRSDPPFDIVRQMIKAIIFDCFGVLVEGTFQPYIDKYLRNDDANIKKFHELDKTASIGQIGHDEFTTEAAKLADIPKEEAQQFFDNNPANLKLFDFMKKQLKPNYKIGFLSNASQNWMNDLFTPEQQSLFDDVVISFEHNMAKPDPGIFKLAAKRLGVNEDECIFVDDLTTYCAGAVNVGMQAICYKSFDEFVYEINKLLTTLG